MILSETLHVSAHLFEKLNAVHSLQRPRQLAEEGPE